MANKKNPVDMTQLSKKFEQAHGTLKEKNLKNFGLGTDDKFGVKEAQHRNTLHIDRAKQFQQAEQQNVWTEQANKRHMEQADWATKNKTYREGYTQNNTDFAGMKDLTGYYNDTAGALYNNGNGRGVNKFGTKDMQYVTKLGVNDDVLKSHIGGLGADRIGENLRNHDYATHLHKDGWSAGRIFNNSDKKYIEKNNLNMVDEIFKHAGTKNAAGNRYAYSNMGAFGYKALEDAGRLKEYDALYAKGYNKDAGIGSYNQGKRFVGQDVTYLKRQGYSMREIAEHMGSMREGDNKVGLNYWAANLLNKSGMMDYYTGDKTVADYNKKKAKADAQAYKDIKVKQIQNKNSNNNIDVNTELNQNQSVGNNKTFNNNVNGNNNSNIGNDYSVNIASQGGLALTNMQDAMGFIGLNDNGAAKDAVKFNPYEDVGFSMKAVDNAAGKGVDQRAYNSVGLSRRNWGDKARVSENMAFGDFAKIKAPNYKMPDSPSNIFDRVNG